MPLGDHSGLVQLSDQSRECVGKHRKRMGLFVTVCNLSSGKLHADSILPALQLQLAAQAERPWSPSQPNLPDQESHRREADASWAATVWNFLA
uniref:Uncharacterized protein n=1 Tax=Sphaerodactylus townsendi TaxID=933632 RepID=A0ACB8EAX3_9SAUR